MRKLIIGTEKRCLEDPAIRLTGARTGLPLPTPVERLLDALVERLLIEMQERSSDTAPDGDKKKCRK